MEIKEYTTYHEAEILSLYASVGWAAYIANPEALREGFANSLLVRAPMRARNYWASSASSAMGIPSCSCRTFWLRPPISAGASAPRFCKPC